MWNSICHFIAKISRWQTLAILSILYLLVILVLFPYFSTASEVQPLDLFFSYSPQQAYQLLDQYTPLQRKNYAISAMTLDVLYPLIYSSLFAVLLSLLLKNGKNKSQNWTICPIVLLPFMILILDLLENTGIVVLLKNYPQHLNTLVQITSVATSLKWVFAGIVIAISLSLLLIRGIGYLTRHRV